MLFQALSELMPATGTIQMAMTVKDGQMTVSLVPCFEGDGSPLVPLSMTGAPEEIDERFIEAVRDFTPSVQGVSDNLEQARIAAEAKAAEAKAKTEKAKPAAKKKTKAEAEAEEMEKRKTAPLDEKQVESLVSLPSSDGNFTTTLKGASPATLAAALKDEKLVGLTALKVIATELAKFRDENADQLLSAILPPKVRAAENGVREKLGKALEKASGKSLEEWGLAPQQLNLMSTLPAI